MKSWINTDLSPGFGLDNIPLGVALKSESERPHMVSRIGDSLIDLKALSELGYLDMPSTDAKRIFGAETIQPFLASGPQIWNSFRQRIQTIFSESDATIQANPAHIALVVSMIDNSVRMVMPMKIGNYTDFYSSIYHATNVGKMMRPDNPLMPNWKHMPIAYHGRASSIVISDTDIRRPCGQQRPDAELPPVFGPSKQLDFELEMAFVVGVPNQLGNPIPIANAQSHIYGMVIFNDWSARDIQSWEYAPLGPFLGKNFGSSISPWVISMEALVPFRTQGILQDVAVLEYLQNPKNSHYDIDLQVWLAPQNGEQNLICESNFKYMYWSMSQQLTHHAVGGCNMEIGDLCASGTLSGPNPESYGCMLEITQRGKHPITLKDGTKRGFLQDHDQIILKAFAKNQDHFIDFGQLSGKILPALI